MKREMQKLFRSGCALCLVLTLCIIAGCQSMTPEQRRDATMRTCLGYGFLPDSPAMDRCIRNLEPAR